MLESLSTSPLPLIPCSSSPDPTSPPLDTWRLSPSVLEIVLAFFCMPGTLALAPIAPSLLDWESESAMISLGLFRVGGTEAVVGAEGDALPVAPDVEGPVLGPLELPEEAKG